MTAEVERPCCDCGGPVVRTGTRGTWPRRCPGCRTAHKQENNRRANRLRRARYPDLERARVRSIVQRDPEANRRRVKAWQEAHPDRVAAQRAKRALTETPEQRRNYTLRSRYGITLDEQHEMSARQGGLCPICGCRLDARNLAVDHDHETGQVRGLLCRGCNVGLGAFEADPMQLQAAFAYLTATERPWLPQRLQERKAR